mmetsp:Transcript_15873/g.43832  ORF Transcript_15873/g.43832 Transcript_15873/m.43832 type:complete len:90 (+) Transcript_15873:266-535(+)
MPHVDDFETLIGSDPIHEREIAWRKPGGNAQQRNALQFLADRSRVSATRISSGERHCSDCIDQICVVVHKEALFLWEEDNAQGVPRTGG